MPIYICEKCKKEFNKKSAYDSHLSRKTPCIDNDIYKNNTCNDCNKIFSTKFNLKKHMIICKKIIANNDSAQIEELKEMLFKQQKEILELKESNKNITITDNSNTTNNTTNNNLNINIYSAGKEDLSRLSHEEIIKICTSGTYYPIVAAEIIHCNKKYPEFQNFLISNLRSNTGLVFINDNWVSKSQDEILSSLMHVDKKHVSDLMKDLKVDDKLQVKLESTKEEIDNNESKEHQKPKIRSKLYNASKMVNKNKKIKDKVNE
jgi:hypothetical protein